MKRCILVMSVIASLIVAPTASAHPAATSGFVGTWTGIQCPSLEGAEPDCSLSWGVDSNGDPEYGDGSTETLKISNDLVPAVTYQDTYSDYCDLNGWATRWVATGPGEYTDNFTILWVNFTKSGCGALRQGAYTIQLYHDPGSDTIWQDPDGDGLGNLWTRVH